MMARGGKRENAGRKTKFTYMRKQALANEVTIRMQENPGLSVNKAIQQLQLEGYISPQTRNRYLTPEHFDPEVLEILKKCKREGILTLLPRLSKDDPL